MKQKLASQALFIGKSLLWSLLMYMTVMLAVNWEDVTKRKKGEEGQSWVKKTEQKELIPVKAGSGEDGFAGPSSTIGSISKAAGFVEAAAEILF